MTKSLVRGLVVALALAGCATAPTPSPSAIVEADQDAVAGCRYLGNVTGRAATGATRGQDVEANTARVKALEQAALLRATHVVWILGDTVGDPARAEAAAYRCGGGDD